MQDGCIFALMKTWWGIKMKNYFSTRKAKFVAAATLIGVGVLSFQNCSKLNTSGTLNGAATASQIVSSSMGGVFASTGASNGAPRCNFNGDLNGWPSSQRGPTTEVIGTISLSYSASDGTGSGKCRYNLGTVGSVNAGTGFNVEGTCTDPSGKDFPTKGTFWPVLGSPSPATSFNMLAGIGDCGPGDEISLQGIVNLVNSQVSNVTITETIITSNTSNVKTLATGSGTYSGKNPFGAYEGWSTIVPSLALPEGSTCKAVANPWGASEVIVAKCTAQDGRSFSLSGQGYLRGALAAGKDFDIEGVAQDGSTYDHFYKNRNGEWIGTWLNKQPVGYNLDYFDRSGVAMGSCSLGTPNANGDISGTCLLKNTAFAISGNIGALANDGLYHVSLAGIVNGVSFTATVAFDATKGNGSGSWSSTDGGSGSVSATAMK